MRLRLDLHLHTTVSRDSSVEIDDAIRRCREEDFDGFAVTDHDALARIPREISEDSDLIIMPGMEVSARGAHILAYSIQDPVPMSLSISETVKRIHKQGGIAVLAHPYSLFRSWVNEEEVKEASFDAVEVINAYQFPLGYTLRKSKKLAEKLGLPVTGGSDAHIPRVVGRAYTVVDADTRDREGVLRALRAGRTSAEGRGISISERLKIIR